MRRSSVWLNSACLGPSNSQEGQLDTSSAAESLRAAYSRCSRWAADWCAAEFDQVLLTAGASDGCDIALTTRVGVPNVIIYSDLAHECTQSSAACAADYLSTISGRKILAKQVKLSDLFDRKPHEFASELASRVGALCSSGNGVFVVEHVTSEDGMLLPVLEISGHLRCEFPGIDLVIDGAQAAGLWRPPSGLDRAYVGCFHKYIDGPAGTGFCVLPARLASRTLHRLRATQASITSSASEHLPTTEVLKWNACREAIDALAKRGCPEDRLATILRARQELLERVPSELTLHLSTVRPEYLSHIISFRTFDNGESEALWRRLAACGFSTKQLDHGARVTIDDSIRIESLRAFADVLREFVGLVARE